ncbi:MAG: SWIM zinc finger family protein, partial [Oscillospiraceae bacterium]|nr:SWIM zinc finger family protein [Oscillospiraceae bacterium]
MPSAEMITDELVRSLAPNTSAVSNGQKISRSGGFISLCRSEDKTLIFGECKGSGSKPYNTSADFSGDSPVFRCSCPSRQFPCKHSLAIMFEWLAGKEFKVSEVPDDIAAKRGKIAKKAEKAAAAESAPDSEKKKKTNKAAVTKKLKKQAEGLDLAENFVNDILNRGISSVNSSSAMQYKNIAKQLGDYYLPEPQAIMNEIISAAEKISENPDDREAERLIALCVKLASTVKKSREYINSKLESGEVLPEDSILYEAMGGIWKLTQLKEIGLYKENAEIIQLSFTVIHDTMHMAEVDTGYWIDLESGEI